MEVSRKISTQDVHGSDCVPFIFDAQIWRMNVEKKNAFGVAKGTALGRKIITDDCS